MVVKKLPGGEWESLAINIQSTCMREFKTVKVNKQIFKFRELNKKNSGIKQKEGNEEKLGRVEKKLIIKIQI